MSQYYTPVDTSLIIQSLVMSAGLGVTRWLSLWAQIPRIQSSAEGDWEIGAPVIGFRWRPVSSTIINRFNIFVNEGFVFPVRQTGISEDRQSNTVNTLARQGVYLNRFVAELWFLSQAQRAIGSQLLWDFALNENSDGFSPGRVFQLTVHTLDYQFSMPGIIPYFALLYRHERTDRFGSNIVANSSGWIVQGVAALNLRITPTERITISVSTPLIIGIERAQMKQVNLGLTLRSTTPLRPKMEQ